MSDDATFQPQAQEASKPPFVVKGWVALAYVRGHYNPPSGVKDSSTELDFLGLYISKDDPGFGLLTFTSSGGYLAFHRCGDPDATVAFAMIDAWLHYHVPFEQWQIYPAGQSETDIVEEMGLKAEYDNAMKGFAAVLYQARLSMQPSHKNLPPIFLLLPRSEEEIQADQAMEDAIRRLLLGEERANRFRELKAKLRRDRE